MGILMTGKGGHSNNGERGILLMDKGHSNDEQQHGGEESILLRDNIGILMMDKDTF